MKQLRRWNASPKLSSDNRSINKVIWIIINNIDQCQAISSNRSLNQSLNPSAIQTIDQASDPSTSQSIRTSMNEFINQVIKQSVNQTINLPINHSFSQSNSYSVNTLSNPRSKQLINRSIRPIMSSTSIKQGNQTQQDDQRFRDSGTVCPSPVTGKSVLFRFRFPFVRVVRAVRAGGAKLRRRHSNK